jgi:hypothetical protein
MFCAGGHTSSHTFHAVQRWGVILRTLGLLASEPETVQW